MRLSRQRFAHFLAIITTLGESKAFLLCWISGPVALVRNIRSNMSSIGWTQKHKLQKNKKSKKQFPSAKQRGQVASRVISLFGIERIIQVFSALIFWDGHVIVMP